MWAGVGECTVYNCTFDSYINKLKQRFLLKLPSRKMPVTEVYFCNSKQLSLAVIQNGLLLNKQFLCEKAMVISNLL